MEEAAKIHSEADIDGDGQVTLDELKSQPAVADRMALPKPVKPVRAGIQNPQPAMQQQQQQQQQQGMACSTATATTTAGMACSTATTATAAGMACSTTATTATTRLGSTSAANATYYSLRTSLQRMQDWNRPKLEILSSLWNSNR